MYPFVVICKLALGCMVMTNFQSYEEEVLCLEAAAKTATAVMNHPQLSVALQTADAANVGCIDTDKLTVKPARDLSQDQVGKITHDVVKELLPDFYEKIKEVIESGQDA